MTAQYSYQEMQEKLAKLEKENEVLRNLNQRQLGIISLKTQIIEVMQSRIDNFEDEIELLTSRLNKKPH